MDYSTLKIPPHLGKSCYNRGGCVPIHWLRICPLFVWNCLVLEKKFVRNSWIIIDYVTSFQIYSHCYQSSRQFCDCNTITNQAGIMALGHEQTFHSRFAYKQVRRKLMRLRRVTFHMTIPIWYKSHLKNPTRFSDSTATFIITIRVF